MSTAYKEMTDDQRLDLLDAIEEAEERGDESEAKRLQLLIPLSVSSFKVVKALFGKDYVQHLQEEGYDFSQVEAVYGKHYLD